MCCSKLPARHRGHAARNRVAAQPLARRAIRRAIPIRTSQTCERKWPPTRAASRRSSVTCNGTLCRCRAYLHASTCRTTRPAACERDRTCSRRIPYEMDSGQVIAVRIDIDRATRSAAIDFTGTSAQDPHNFNAPRAVCLRGCAVRFPHPHRAAHPLNEGCLEPSKVIIPAARCWIPAARGRGRRQRRDLAMHRRCAVRRPGGTGGLARHDEQPHIRRQPIAVLRNDLPAAQERAPISTVATLFRLT